jgi:hypothetical protein
MAIDQRSARAPVARPRSASQSDGGARRSRLAFLAGGGTDGNELLTAATGALLIVLLAALGLTIVAIGRLLWLHLFLGMLLIGPVALKLASTGYRFVRYYTRNASYRLKGPPHALLRMIAPMIVITTVVVFASGVALLFAGPSSRATLLPIHKVSFIVWIVFTAPHVLAHLLALPKAWRADYARPRAAALRSEAAGRGGRVIALAGALVAGVVLAIVLIPEFAAWTSHAGAFGDHFGR